MRLLLDENLDWRLSRDLIGHETDSVPLLGWGGTKNGALLKPAAESGYEVRSMEHGAGGVPSGSEGRRFEACG